VAGRRAESASYFKTNILGHSKSMGSHRSPPENLIFNQNPSKISPKPGLPKILSRSLRNIEPP
jgi:hypothetical protein